MSRMRRFILLFLLAYTSTSILFLSLVAENNYFGQYGWSNVTVPPSISSGVRRLRDNPESRSKSKFGSQWRRVNISYPLIDSCSNDVKYNSRLEEVYVLLTKSITLYSAYYDAREDIPFIRIISTVKPQNKEVRLWCHFDSKGDSGTSNTSCVTPVSYYQMCENHKREIGGWILSCQVPKCYVDKGRQPCVVSVSLSPKESSTNSVEMSILTTERSPQETQVDFAVCVPPLFGKIRKDQIVQFVELTRMLGANHFMFYVHDVKPNVKEVLKHYESLGIATIRKWAVPSKSPRSIWYHGQSLAINDCLYRHMANVQYLIFNDVDEFLIPHGPDMRTWRDIVASQHSFTNTCAMTFKSAFFDLAFRNNQDFVVRNVSVLDITTRAVSYCEFRNKVMVEPYKVFEMGIHHVSRPWPDFANYSVVDVSPQTAYIHHYRPCKSFTWICIHGQIDTTLVDKYGEDFFINYNRTMNIIPD